MNWKKVKIVAQEGVEIGVVYSESGELCLIVKDSNGNWPHKLDPIPGTTETITATRKAYVISDSGM